MPKRTVPWISLLSFAQVTLAAGFMFVCCVSCDCDGRFGDVRAQAQQAFDNILEAVRRKRA